MATGTANEFFNLSPTNTVSISTHCLSVEAKNALLPLSPAPPLTPERQKREQIQDFSLDPSPPDLAFFYSNQAHTPKHSVFDAFAPGPSKFMLAPPKSRKYLETSVVRRLNFACSKNLVRDINHEEEEEEHLFESLYFIILDSIVSEQTKERDGRVKVSDLDGYRTPKFRPLLNGVAEMCPGAPMKSKSQYRNIDMELCRKLEF